MSSISYFSLRVRTNVTKSTAIGPLAQAIDFDQSETTQVGQSQENKSHPIDEIQQNNSNDAHGPGPSVNPSTSSSLPHSSYQTFSLERLKCLERPYVEELCEELNDWFSIHGNKSTEINVMLLNIVDAVFATHGFIQIDSVPPLDHEFVVLSNIEMNSFESTADTSRNNSFHQGRQQVPPSPKSFSDFITSSTRQTAKTSTSYKTVSTMVANKEIPAASIPDQSENEFHHFEIKKYGLRKHDGILFQSETCEFFHLSPRQNLSFGVDFVGKDSVSSKLARSIYLTPYRNLIVTVKFMSTKSGLLCGVQVLGMPNVLTFSTMLTSANLTRTMVVRNKLPCLTLYKSHLESVTSTVVNQLICPILSQLRSSIGQPIVSDFHKTHIE